MKHWPIAVFALFTASLMAGDFERKISLSISISPFVAKDRKYLVQTYGSTLFHNFANMVGLNNPIYKILPIDGGAIPKPFLQSAKDFHRQEILDKRQLIDLLQLKRLNVAIAHNELVIGQAESSKLLTLISKPVFVGALLMKNGSIHLTDVSDSELGVDYLARAYDVGKDFFSNFQVLVRKGQTTFSEIDTVNDGFFVDTFEY